MRECPQCHKAVPDTDRFCKYCGAPLTAVPAEETVPAAAVPAEETVPAANKRPPRSKKPLVIVIVAAAAVLGIVLSVTHKKSPAPPKVVEMEAEDAISQIEKNYEGRTFDESLDMSLHKGLLSAADVTGPFLEIRKEDNSYYVPDTVEDENAGKGALPDGVKIVEAGEEYFPKEYRQLIQSGDKAEAAAKGKEDQVYALMEYTGYRTAGNYNNGNFILYGHTSRISFYSLESGEMLGWMTTSKDRHGPFILYSNNYGSDGQHPILEFENDSIWSEEAWTNGLDELFYDENGYQVVGDRLLSVPEGVNTIEVPEGVRIIEDNVGTSHTASELILPEGVERIGESAFSSSSLVKITIPDSVVYVDDYAFNDTPWINEKKATEEWLVVGDGVLIKCTAKDKELEIPDNVHYIMPRSLAELECTKITIPSTVRQMCAGVHNTMPPISLESLEELVIKGGLKEEIKGVPVQVLSNCTNLKKVVVDCDMPEELPGDWILGSTDSFKKMVMICPDDSAAAKWADSNQVKHQEK